MMFTSRRKAILIIIFLVVLALGIVVAFTFNPKSVDPDHHIPTAEQAGEIVIRGEMVCLPHKDTSGPQTMECAFGLHGTDGRYFALRDTDPTYKNISGIPMGTGVEVMVNFTPQQDEKYPTVGVIEVTSITAN